MPGNLIWILAAWMANHLIAFSLLGFAIAGLFVFGVIGSPAGGTANTALESHFGSVGPAQKALPSLPPSTAVGGPETRPMPGEPVHDEPRLIGGSLPVYQGRGFGAAAPGGSFRPPAEEAGTVSPRPTREELLQQARRAFWNGDFEGAEAGYMALISEYPADADAFGELGNLYQSMAKPAQALDAYYEAGIRLRATGDAEKLQQIIDIFAQEADPRGDQLRP